MFSRRCRNVNEYLHLDVYEWLHINYCNIQYELFVLIHLNILQIKTNWTIMKNKSLIVVYIIQTQTVSLENIPYFDCIFFVEYHHVSLYTCIYINFFFLVFIDLKAGTFFKRIILEVKFCSISVNILPPDT